MLIWLLFSLTPSYSVKTPHNSLLPCSFPKEQAYQPEAITLSNVLHTYGSNVAMVASRQSLLQRHLQFHVEPHRGNFHSSSSVNTKMDRQNNIWSQEEVFRGTLDDLRKQNWIFPFFWWLNWHWPFNFFFLKKGNFSMFSSCSYMIRLGVLPRIST